VATANEHNSVLRPLRVLERKKEIDHQIIPCDHDGVISSDAFKEMVSLDIALVAVNHCSNVTGDSIHPAMVTVQETLF
jgi:cysteine sulfinate desulfinase/cysteine desulfurase-like protein